MNFMEIAQNRQSCRRFDAAKPVENEKLASVLEAARLAPSACNAQPYHLTVLTGEAAKGVARETTGMGMNKFTENAPVIIVITEDSYNASAAIGVKIKKLDYRLIDIGIMAAYLTSEAAAQGLSTCILGWFDDEKIRALIDCDKPVRLVIALGYAEAGDALRPKKRKDASQLITYKK